MWAVEINFYCIWATMDLFFSVCSLSLNLLWVKHPSLRDVQVKQPVPVKLLEQRQAIELDNTTNDTYDITVMCRAKQIFEMAVRYPSCLKGKLILSCSWFLFCRTFWSPPEKKKNFIWNIWICNIDKWINNLKLIPLNKDVWYHQFATAGLSCAETLLVEAIFSCSS